MMIRLLACPWICQYRRASLAAVSIASEPPLTKNTLASSIGAMAATRSASRSAWSLVIRPNVWNVSSRRICAAAASARRARPWPMLAYHSAAVASSSHWPSSVWTFAPSPATIVSRSPGTVAIWAWGLHSAEPSVGAGDVIDVASL